MEPRLKMIRGK